MGLCFLNLRRGVYAIFTLNILGQLGEVVVGELGLGGHQHLVVQLVAEYGLTRQEEKERHVVLSAAVDDRVVIVVRVNEGGLIGVVNREFTCDCVQISVVGLDADVAVG